MGCPFVLLISAVQIKKGYGRNLYRYLSYPFSFPVLMPYYD